MGLNNVDSPSKQALVEIMRKVNALGHEPRVIVELDKFSYVRGLKRMYEVTRYIEKTITKNIVSIESEYTDSDGTDVEGVINANPPVMPIQGKNKLSDMSITSRHRTVNPERPTHKGLDLDLAIGDPLVASWSGVVVEAKDYGNTGYGKEVLIDHGNGVQTRYAHMDSFAVGVGDNVRQGDVIGTGGNSGGVRSSTGDGSHLHYEVLKDGVDLNPELVLNGSISMNAVASPANGGKGTTVKTKKTITKTTEKVGYDRDFNKVQPYDTKWENMQGKYFTMATPAGVKKMFGISDGLGANQTKGFLLNHTWFNDGYLEFSYFLKKGIPEGSVMEVRVDGKKVWQTGSMMNVDTGIIMNPAPIPIKKGTHRIWFTITNPTNKPDPNMRYGLMRVKAAEYDEVEEQVTVDVPLKWVDLGGTTNSGAEYKSTIWDYEDGMGNPAKWNKDGDVINGGDYLQVPDGSTIRRSEVVPSFPFTTQFTAKVAPGSTNGKVTVANGKKSFTVNLTPTTTKAGSGSYAVDNTTWQDYMLVAKDDSKAVLFVKSGGVWTDTGLNVTATSSSDNKVAFSSTGGDLYVDDVKYVDKDFSSSTPSTKIERKEVEKWYDLGGFVFDETFYLEEDIMSWEVATHLDMSSSTATVTLSNHHGFYSADYVRDPVFPDNMQKSPYSYFEEGEIRHILSEYTPVRIYAGYGNEIVRVFTGMIKGEIQENSEERTITFHCVDRYDILEECVLLKDLSFPFAEDAGVTGDNVRRPWIKSSIIQYLANFAGMTGWRYVYEDLLHPDLSIEETYFTDINRTNDTFMKFDSNGKLSEVKMGEVKSPKGYRNPFVEDVTFKAGERVSDCIRRVAEEINFRTFTNRYGTFIMHHIDFENNMRWNFRSGENLMSLETSTDYSRVRNHIIVAGENGNTENFFDKDLILATKGQVRTASIECPWISETDGTTARGAKQVVADKLFFDMKRQARTKNVVVKGNPFIEILDGCYVYDANTSTAGYYIIKGNTMIGDSNGIINRLELTWEQTTQ